MVGHPAVEVRLPCRCWALVYLTGWTGTRGTGGFRDRRGLIDHERGVLPGGWRTGGSGPRNLAGRCWHHDMDHDGPFDSPKEEMTVRHLRQGSRVNGERSQPNHYSAYSYERVIATRDHLDRTMAILRMQSCHGNSMAGHQRPRTRTGIPGSGKRGTGVRACGRALNLAGRAS